MRNFKIVTDGNLYAIRKGWVFYKYCSLNTLHWWDKYEAPRWCWGTKEEVLPLYLKLKGGVEVDPTKL